MSPEEPSPNTPPDGPATPDGPSDTVSAPGFALDPQRLLRIAGLTREVLEEARRIRPEAGAVDHLRRVHGEITDELRVGRRRLTSHDGLEK